VIGLVRTYYSLLGVDPGADADEIRAAYRRRSKEVHPDAGGDRELFLLVQLAHDTLVDPDRRAAYDRTLAAPSSERASTPSSSSPSSPTPVPASARAGAAILLAVFVVFVVVLVAVVSLSSRATQSVSRATSTTSRASGVSASGVSAPATVAPSTGDRPTARGDGPPAVTTSVLPGRDLPPDIPRTIVPEPPFARVERVIEAAGPGGQGRTWTVTMSADADDGDLLDRYLTTLVSVGWVELPASPTDNALPAGFVTHEYAQGDRRLSLTTGTDREGRMVLLLGYTPDAG
jgi:hypothetical protein